MDVSNVDVQELVSQVEIVDYIAQYADLREKTPGEYFCHCMFHDEKTPSFSVVQDKQFFYCFGCGVSGDILEFIRLYEKVDFSTSLQILRKYLRLDERQLPTTLGCIKYLRSQKAAKEKKSDHKRLPADFMDQYVWDPTKYLDWVREGIRLDILRQYDVRYDVAANRIRYPIWDVHGNIVTTQGRTLDPQYKENRLSKYIYYPEFGAVDFLYNYHIAAPHIHESNEIILFEGVKSVFKAEGWGIQNTCSPMTSNISRGQMELLAGISAKVCIAFDSDVDIKSVKNAYNLGKYVPVYYIQNVDNLLGEKMSPVDAGLDVWQTLYDRKVRLR